MSYLQGLFRVSFHYSLHRAPTRNDGGQYTLFFTYDHLTLVPLSHDGRFELMPFLTPRNHGYINGYNLGM